MKIGDVRTLLPGEGWTVETIPYPDAYRTLGAVKLGYKTDSSGHPTKMGAHCATIEVWSADRANEQGWQPGNRIMFAFDAAGRLLKTATWASGSTVWHGIPLTKIAELAERCGHTGRQRAIERATRNDAEAAVRADNRQRGERLAGDAAALLAELGHDCTPRLNANSTTVDIDLETLLAVLRTAVHTKDQQ